MAAFFRALALCMIIGFCPLFSGPKGPTDGEREGERERDKAGDRDVFLDPADR